MSELKTNTIATNDANNVAMDNALKLKSYTTTQRDALTSVAGDTIYNSTTSKVQVYNGSSWDDLGGPAVVKVDYVVIGGGGSGGSSSGTGHSGGGGAGGYLSHYASENSGGGDTNSADFYVPVSTNLTVTIGAGAAANAAGRYVGFTGTGSHFANISPAGGGGGGCWGGLIGNKNYYLYNAQDGASGGGQASIDYDTSAKSSGTLYQGYAGGSGTDNSLNTDSTRAGGGGGGASAVGANASSGQGGNGGAGVSSSITGSAVERAGGGGGGATATAGTATGGGGAGGDGANGTAGTANTGGGGGGSSYNGSDRAGGAGGSGVVILRYPNTFTISQSGLTLSTATSGDDKITTITAGTGTVSFT